MGKINKADKELATLCTALAQRKAKAKDIEIETNALNKRLIAVLKENNRENFKINFEDSEKNVIKYNFALRKRRQVAFDVDKVKEIVTKEQKERLIQKTVSIVDYNAFVQIMKKYKVPFSEVKEYLDIRENVSTKALQTMHEVGDIDLQDLKDCYEMITTEYISMNKIKPKEEASTDE